MKKLWASLVVSILLLGLIPPPACPAVALETEISDFIKRFYDNQDIQIAFTQLPPHGKEASRIRTITFTKVPDANGDGICLIGVSGKNGSEANLYVPFKVFVKRKLYVLKHAVKKGDVIHLRDTAEKETYLNGTANVYPASIEDIVGKQAKKEIYAGEVITSQVLEEQVAVQKGGVINLNVENKRLLVAAKGVALERGRVGDMIRVKSASGKEISGKVTGSNTVKVEF